MNRLSRRTIIAGAGFAMARMFIARPQITSGANGLASVCGVENWGIQAMWSLGHGLPPIPLHEALPGGDWVSIIHPTFPAIYFLSPPTWSTYVTQQPYYEVPPAVVLVSPEGDAAFTTVAMDGMNQTARVVAELGIRRVSPPDETLPIVCADSGEDIFGNQAAVVVAADATAYAISGALVVGGIPSYTACYGWADRFEERTRRVFLPIVYQFLNRGSIGEWKSKKNSGDDDDDDDDDS